jgi:hypothetical protein
VGRERLEVVYTLMLQTLVRNSVAMILEDLAFKEEKIWEYWTSS